MTRAPFVMSKGASAFGRDVQLFDTSLGWRFVNPGDARRSTARDSMGETAENVAEQYGVSRADQDAFAAALAAEGRGGARGAGRFAEEIVAGGDPAAARGPAVRVDARRVPAPGHHARDARASCGRRSAPTARARSRPATPRGSTMARRRCSSRRSDAVQRAGPHARGARRGRGGGRRRAAHHGHGPGAGHAAGAAARRPHARADGRDRAQRGVRRAVAGLPARARPRRRRSARESERRRDRARASARHERRAARAHRHARAAARRAAATRCARCASAWGRGTPWSSSAREPA